MRPVVIEKSLAAYNAAGIAAFQSLSGPGALVLNGPLVQNGVAILDTQRRVGITSAGNDSGITWTVKGTNGYGQPQVDVFPGANATTAQSNLDFLTVTSITASGATASTVTAGTTMVGSSAWRMPSTEITPFVLDVIVQVTGTVTYNIEVTLDDYWTPRTFTAMTGPYADPPFVQPVLTGETGSTQLTITSPFKGWRVTITSGSATGPTGTVRAIGQQAGIVQ